MPTQLFLLQLVQFFCAVIESERGHLLHLPHLTFDRASSILISWSIWKTAILIRLVSNIISSSDSSSNPDCLLLLPRPSLFSFSSSTTYSLSHNHLAQAKCL
jgi:hypothetical protein